MIMLYRRRTNNLKVFFTFKNSVTIFFVVAIILIGAIDPSSITKPLQSVALSFYLVKNNIEDRILNLFSSIKLKGQLSEENRNLNKQYSALNTFCTLSIQNLKNKQDELEKSLGRKSVGLKNYIGTGYVIAKPPISSYGTVIIDLGEKSGIKVGDEAIVGGYIIGSVSDTFIDRSVIKLYGDKDENLPMLIGVKRLMLSGQGNGSGVFKIRAANEVQISVGESVWLSNAPDYIFGTIIISNQSSSDRYQDLTAKSPINIFELLSVDIVSNGKR